MEVKWRKKKENRREKRREMRRDDEDLEVAIARRDGWKRDQIAERRGEKDRNYKRKREARRRIRRRRR